MTVEDSPEAQVKARLRRYSDLLDEIDMQRQRLDRMRAECGSPRSPRYDGMPKAKGSDPDWVHREAMMIIRLEERVADDEAREAEERRDLERMVSKVPRAMERAVLRMRYFDRCDWEWIAFAVYGDKEDYFDRADEYRQRVYRRHSDAVLSLALVDADEAIVRRSA